MNFDFYRGKFLGLLLSYASPFFRPDFFPVLIWLDSLPGLDEIGQFSFKEAEHTEQRTKTDWFSISYKPNFCHEFRSSFAFCALCSVSVRPLFGVILPYACSCLHQCLDPEIAHGISCCDAEPIPEQIDHLNLLTIQTICVSFPLCSGKDLEKRVHIYLA